MNTTTKGCLTAVVLVVLAGVALYFVPMPDARDEEPQASVDVSLIPETAWLDNRYAGGAEQVPLSGGLLMALMPNSSVGVFGEGEWGREDTLRAVDLDTGATLWEVDGLSCNTIMRNERLIVEASTVGCEARVEPGSPEVNAVFDAAGNRTDYPMPYTDSLGYDQWDDGLLV